MKIRAGTVVSCFASPVHMFCFSSTYVVSMRAVAANALLMFWYCCRKECCCCRVSSIIVFLVILVVVTVVAVHQRRCPSSRGFKLVPRGEKPTTL